MDATGAFFSVLIADAVLTLNSKDSFAGVTAAQIHFANGNILPLPCATITGERMKVGSLADQCQTLLPPQ